MYSLTLNKILLTYLLTVTSCFSHVILLLRNFIFFVRYPVHLALSLLSITPKKGNLLLPKHYRGIQVVRAVLLREDSIVGCMSNLNSLLFRRESRQLCKFLHYEY